MTETLREFIASASESIEAVFDHSGEIEPVWHCVKADGTEFLVRPPCVDKDLAVTLLRSAFRMMEVRRCLFISEAWTAQGDRSEVERWIANGRSLSEHPDREEIVMFSGEDECMSLSAHRRILRPANGKASLGPLRFLDDITISEGRLVGMLPRRGATMQ